MTRDQFEAARKRLKATLNGTTWIEKAELERLIDAIGWLKKRLRQVETAIVPLVSKIKRRIR
jgi:hypothetical protein